MDFRAIASAIILCVSSSALAQDESLLAGIATTDCEKMQRVVDLDRVAAERIFGGWLDGFLSGFNLGIYLEVSRDAAINLNTATFPNAEVRYQWLLAACKSDQNAPLWAHATNLFGLIRKSQ